MVRKRRAATFWLPVVRWRVLSWLGLRTARLSSGLGLPSSARKSGTSFPIMRCFRVVQPALRALVAATHGTRSYGNQRTRSDRRNPDRSTPGRTWSVGACPACSLHRPRGADLGHRLVCVLSDLSIGHSPSRAAIAMRWPQARAGKGRQERGLPGSRRAKSKSRLPRRTGATIKSLPVLAAPHRPRRPAGNLARGHYWGFRSAVLGVLGQASEPSGVPSHGRPNAFGVAGNRF
jgi:hypothetical protein